MDFVSDKNRSGADEPPAQHCIVCGVLQTPENTSETRRGSGRLRSKCKKCTREPYYRQRNPKVAKLKFKGITINISGTRNKSQQPVFVEHNNPVSQAVQTFHQLCPRCGQSTHESDVLFCPECGRYGLDVERCPICSQTLRFARKCPDCGVVIKPINVEMDLVCKECGNVVRYDSKRNRVCDGCGLVAIATEAEIMEQVRKRNPGERAVEFNREIEWKMLEHNDSSYVNPYQSLFWSAPEDCDEKVIPDIDPADVPSDDTEQ